jgi:predicted DNA-binding transcriptional regulator AlpA
MANASVGPLIGSEPHIKPPSGMDRLLTPEDVSNLLGIPTKTLANWRSERVGPLPLRIGCHVRYRASDVSAWLEERVEAAQSWMAH